MNLILRNRIYWLVITLLIGPLAVSGHPGGLDANGGHTDRSSGEYHHHQAPPVAGQGDAAAEQQRPTAAAVNAISGKVVSVHDGDTLTLLTSGSRQLRIRLDGIDAPESKQAFGQKSREALAGYVAGKTVTVKVVTIDRYGRTVGRVLFDDEDVNLHMVSNGWAWWYREYAPKDRAMQFAEEDARDNQRGLWAGSDPLPPWVFRKSR